MDDFDARAKQAIPRDAVLPAGRIAGRRSAARRRGRQRLLALLTGVALMAMVPLFVAAAPGKGAAPGGRDPVATDPDKVAPVSSDASDRAVGSPGASDARVSLAAYSLQGSAQPNEMGLIPVLMYHLIGNTDSKYNRTPQEFRQDIATLKEQGYYPINLRDLASGNLDIPAGRSPVVLTFDDSSSGQFRLLPDGTLDPDCAVAIMQEAAQEGDWASRATFFVLLDVDDPDHVLFGQPEYAKTKLRQLVKWGYEIGSHTVTHLDLKKASQSEAKKQLYLSKEDLETMIGDNYEITSLAVPFGSYPAQASILKCGEYQGATYSYTAVAQASGGRSPSPYSSRFRVYHIPRIQVSGSSLAEILANLETSQELRYVSDGDPATVSVPAEIAPELGTPREDLDLQVVRP